jgi:hypothetical protein
MRKTAAVLTKAFKSAAAVAGPPAPPPPGRVSVLKKYPNGAPQPTGKSIEQFDKNLVPSGALQANHPDRVRREEVQEFLRHKYWGH